MPRSFQPQRYDEELIVGRTRVIFNIWPVARCSGAIRQSDVMEKSARYRKDDPAAVVHFKIKGTDADGRDQLTLRQRQVGDVVTAFVEAAG